MYIGDNVYKNLKILILGGAKSGLSVAKLVANDNDVTLTDMNPLKEEDEKYLKELNVKVIITKDQASLIDSSWDLIIKNPAIMYTSEVYQKCLKLNLKVENELEVGYHFLPENVFIIGVTGSNGKTTTTTMIYELLKKMGKSVVLAGNIGEPLCSALDRVKKNDILLLEISDHQLVDMHEFKTNISVLTNICPTHLDYHGTYEHYRDTKKKIFNNHTSKDLAIINYKNSDALLVSKDILSTKIYFNDDKNYFDENAIYIDNKKIITLDDISVVGSHNYENILAALLVIKNFGLDKNIIKEFLKEFKGVEHRLEFVTKKDGVKYYNDSKATNPVATITALKTFKNPIHLILGGQERYQDFNELNDYMGYVKHIYAIGTVTDRLEKYANDIKKPITKCYTLKTAMENVKQNVEEGDIVLLSTASASQDQYKRFEDRGEEFKKLI